MVAKKGKSTAGKSRKRSWEDRINGFCTSWEKIMFRLTQEDRAKIPLATPKPQLVRVVCEDNNQDDPLQLRPLVREQLRAISYAQARGDGTAQAEILYLDAADDDLPGALQPKLRYEFLAGKVSVRIRLTSGNTTIADQAVSASSNDTQALAKMLATKIVAMAVEQR